LIMALPIPPPCPSITHIRIIGIPGFYVENQLPSAKANGLRVQGFKGSSDQGGIFSLLFSNPGILDLSNPCGAKDQTEVFA